MLIVTTSLPSRGPPRTGGASGPLSISIMLMILILLLILILSVTSTIIRTYSSINYYNTNSNIIVLIIKYLRINILKYYSTKYYQVSSMYVIIAIVSSYDALQLLGTGGAVYPIVCHHCQTDFAWSGYNSTLQVEFGKILHSSASGAACRPNTMSRIAIITINRIAIITANENSYHY